ncbi:MAG: glycosyltransferase family 2 protein [Candidatus Omnitrophota bacterium]|nr:glycosyltransferase family 2 protein [Candidatus Omnitrophota bacterium]MDZ4243468.1 glycosyltransferase family 2 protein [Candidatus Omnitrophota bacterium]
MVEGPRKKYLAGICSFNEGDKIRRVLRKFNDYEMYDVLIVDDGSDDNSVDAPAPGLPVTVIRNPKTMGAGYGTRQIMAYAKERGYEAILFVSGNDKDDPADMAKLRKALDDGYDFIQGSRYLPGGRYGQMPFYRIVATRWIHPLFFSLITGKRITDSTNGFRAIRVSLYDDPRIDLSQSWLDAYELEPYLFYKAIRLGYRVTEVPVSKIYPPRKQGYTKMKPFSGWWSILRPLVYLALGIKK